MSLSSAVGGALALAAWLSFKKESYEKATDGVFISLDLQTDHKKKDGQSTCVVAYNLYSAAFVQGKGWVTLVEITLYTKAGLNTCTGL